MRDSLILGTVAAAVFAGCSLIGAPVNEDNYFEVSAKENCKLFEECYAAFFYSEYDDIDDCVDSVLDDAEDYNEQLADDCDFDEDNAQDCMDAYRGMKCEDVYDDYEDIYDACSEVWDCE